MTPLTILVQSFALLVAALAAMRLAKSSPVARVAIGRAALLCTVALALAVPFLAGRFRPVIQLSEPVAATTASPAAELKPLTETPKQPKPSAVQPAPQTVATTSTTTPTLTDPAPVATESKADLALLWPIGSALILLYWLVGHMTLVRLRRRSKSIANNLAEHTLSEVAHELVVRPSVRKSGQIATPFLCGVARPTILLPEALAEGADPETMRAVLLHEVSHVVRGDVLWAYIGRFVQAAFWFQPLFVPLLRQMTAATEELCDAEAVRRGCRPEAYADCLVKIAGESRLGAGGALAVGMAASPSRLGKRIEAILDGSRRIATRLSRRSRFGITIGAALATALGVVLIAPARAGHQGGSTGEGKALWQDVKEAYQNLKSLEARVNISADGEQRWIRFVSVPDRKLTAQVFDVQFRGGDGAPIQVVVDGTNVFVFDPNSPTAYLKAPLGDGSAMDQIQERGHVYSLTLRTFFGNLAKRIDWSAQREFTLGSDAVVDGTPVQTLIITIPAAPSQRTVLLVGRDDHLVREARYDSQDGRGRKYTSVERFSDLKTNRVLPDRTFRFVPPRSAKEVTPPSKPINSPATLRLVDEMVSAAQKVQTVSAEFHWSTQRDGQKASSFVRRVAYGGGGRASVDVLTPKENLHTVSDGKRIVTRKSDDPKRYSLIETPGYPYNVVQEILTGVGYRLPGTTMQIDVELAYMGAPSYQGLTRSFLSLDKPTTFDGEPVQVLVARLPAMNEIGATSSDFTVVNRYYVSPRDFLVRGFEHRETFKGRNIGIDTLGVRNMRLNPTLDDSLFEVQIPRDATPFVPSAARDRAAALVYEADPRTLPGNEPPPLRGNLIDGHPFRLADLKGRVVLLYAWTPGVTNTPGDLRAMERFWKRYRSQGLVVLGLGIRVDPARARKQLADCGVTFPSLVSSPDIETWHIHRFPFNLIIGRDGVVQAKGLWPNTMEPTIQSLLAKR